MDGGRRRRGQFRVADTLGSQRDLGSSPSHSPARPVPRCVGTPKLVVRILIKASGLSLNYLQTSL